MIVSSNLPENGWKGITHSGSNGGWADCTSSAWTELSGEHTIMHGAGVRVGFRIDNKGGTILWDGFELLRNPKADEQLSEEECRTAAALHGWAMISVASSSDRPKGCHYSPGGISSPAFFYNAYVGMAFSSTAYGGDYLAVCKGGAAFPSPPPSPPSPPSSPPGTFTTKASLQTAVQAFNANPTAATATYGPIADWDVSAITDMSYLFYYLTNFNADISNWDDSASRPWKACSGCAPRVPWSPQP